MTHTMARGEDEEDVDEGGLMGSTCQDHRTGLLLAAGYLRCLLAGAGAGAGDKNVSLLVIVLS